MAERETRKETTDVLSTRPNGRGAAPTLENRRTAGKGSFARRESKENVAAEMAATGAQRRPTSSGSSSDNRVTSPQSSRIPRPSQQQTGSRTRRPLTFSEAYKLAEEQEAMRGSPSPAPRTWRTKGDQEDRNIQTLFSQKPVDLGRRRRQARRSDEAIRGDDTISSLDSTGSGSHKSEGSDDFDRKLQQYAEDKARLEGMLTAKNGIFSKSKVGPRVAETGHELHRKTSSNSLESGSPPQRTWGNLAKPDPNWLKRIISNPDKVRQGNGAPAPPIKPDVPIVSVERDPSPFGVTPPRQRPSTVPPTRSPNKSFAWQADADFTAGDLQVSASPPVRTDRTNTKLDEIKALETQARLQFGDDSQQLRQPGRTNTRLDEIRQLEIESAVRFSNSPPRGLGNEAVDEIAGNGGTGASPSDPRYVERTNRKIDEIRAREIESLSRRALAKARLDEIRERNSESRSPSPEVVRKPSPERLQGTTMGKKDSDKDGRRHSSSEEGEHIPNTPVTVFRHSTKARLEDKTGPGIGNQDDAVLPSEDRRDSISKGDSRDVLRRLARVASLSPAPETRAIESEREVKRGGDKTTASKTEGASETKGVDNIKPTVGFAGLQRDPSTDSLSSKRSSMARSDTDPTERIEGEMKLFAPMENHSERGSVRAPSPEAEEDEGKFDETPRPAKIDPLTLPTPKVTGAYVETPATVKVDKPDEVSSQPATSPQKSHSPLRRRLLHPDVASRSRSVPRRAEDTKQENTRDDLPRSKSISSLRRSRSLPRNRSPLINSAKPPTVKDDLMAIHGAHNIEDSTLEDFAELLQFEEANAPAVEKILKSDSLKKEEEEEKPKDLSDREMVLEAYDRMSKSLKTGLMGIRTAKKGIEQLEDQVSHTENIAIFQESKPDETECPHCIAKPATENVAYIHVPVPRLYHRRPQFRLTILGWILFLLAAWYYTENRLWEEYGFTEVCTRRACNLNLDSPYFGQVIPWKLDDWIFGGRVRALYREYEEPLSDWYLDVWETVLFVDIRDISPRVMHPVDREQWRRRMIKKGYIKEPEWVPPTAELAAKLARGRAMLEASERKEAGDDVGGRDDGDGSDDIGSGDETMAADEPVFEESPKKSGWF